MQETLITGIITIENNTPDNPTFKDTTYYLLTQHETFIIQDVENIKCVDPLQCFKDHLVKVKIKFTESRNPDHYKQEGVKNYRKIIIADLKDIGIPESLFVSDGNSNTFLVTSSHLSFDPVDPMYSSSGYYDGGEPAEKTIDKFTFQHLVVQAYSITENKSLRLSQRIKGSLTITIVFKDHTETFFIKPHKNSEEFLEQLRFILKK